MAFWMNLSIRTSVTTACSSYRPALTERDTKYHNTDISGADYEWKGVITQFSVRMVSPERASISRTRPTW